MCDDDKKKKINVLINKSERNDKGAECVMYVSVIVENLLA